MAVGMQDKYTSFAALEAGGEIAGRDYNTTVRERPQSGVLIVAPHGGNIEIGTTELADLIAGTQHRDPHCARLSCPRPSARRPGW